MGDSYLFSFFAGILTGNMVVPMQEMHVKNYTSRSTQGVKTRLAPCCRLGLSGACAYWDNSKTTCTT